MTQLEALVAAVQEVCDDPSLDRRGTYAYGQRVMAKRVLKAMADALESPPDQTTRRRGW